MLSFFGCGLITSNFTVEVTTHVLLKDVLLQTNFVDQLFLFAILLKIEILVSNNQQIDVTSPFTCFLCVGNISKNSLLCCNIPSTMQSTSTEESSEA